MHLLLTCEHATARVPQSLSAQFASGQAALKSHRGVDLGAAECARRWARQTQAPLYLGKISRLVVELNRSLNHPNLFSEFTQGLSCASKEQLLARYYHPHRYAVSDFITRHTQVGQIVVHLGIHSFTPIWQGQKRLVDIGLLFDPQSPIERIICHAWQKKLAEACPQLRIRRNAPYRGTADGLTTSLRRKFGPRVYAGIEVEINQHIACGDVAVWRQTQQHLIETFCQIRASFERNRLLR